MNLEQATADFDLTTQKGRNAYRKRLDANAEACKAGVGVDSLADSFVPLRHIDFLLDCADEVALRTVAKAASRESFVAEWKDGICAKVAALEEENAALRRIAAAASEFLDAEWECAFTEAAAAKHHALSDAVEKWEEFESLEGAEAP